MQLAACLCTRLCFTPSSLGFVCLFVCRFFSRISLQTQEAPAAGSLLARTSLRAGAALHGAEVSHCARAGAARLNAAPHGDPGEDMVPEQALQEQEATVGAGAPLSQELQRPQGLHGRRPLRLSSPRRGRLQAAELPCGRRPSVRSEPRLSDRAAHSHRRPRLRLSRRLPPLPSLAHEAKLSCPLQLSVLPSLCSRVPRLLSTGPQLTLSLPAIPSPTPSSQSPSRILSTTVTRNISIFIIITILNLTISLSVSLHYPLLCGHAFVQYLTLMILTTSNQFQKS